MSRIDTKLRYLEARTNQLTDHMTQLTLNNQKENRHPHSHSWAWIQQRRGMGLDPMTGAEAQVPLQKATIPQCPIMFPLGMPPPHWGTSRVLMLKQRSYWIKGLTKQKDYLHDNLQWLNPKNWFNGLNLQVWVMAALGCLLVLILICALGCMWRLFSQDRIQEQQIVGFPGLTTTIVFTNRKGGDVGNCPAWFQKL